MQKVENNNNSLFTLNDLISDSRLMRLFERKSGACAVQLWILQITQKKLTESKLVYGRIIPYNFDENAWFFSDNDKFKKIKNSKIQIIQLNLYIKTELCTNFLQKICDGQSLFQISKELELSATKNFISKFGDFKLQHQYLVYEPVSYLWNKDKYKQLSKSSPHGSASAFSASIVQTNKNDLFLIDETYNAELTKFIVQKLKNDINLNSEENYERLGNIELLVFPTLDNFERNLLDIRFNKESNLIAILFDSSQLPHFSKFQFRVNIENNRNLVYSAIAEAEELESELFRYTFEFDQKIGEISDFLEIEVFGFKNNTTNLGELCSRWACGLIREIGININAVNSSNPTHVKFDWLEKTTNPNQHQRVHCALTKNNSLRNSHSLIGGRDSDPWVKINRSLGSLFKQLHPSKSEGKFFLRWGPSNGEGRLQFVEWFQSLLNKYKQNQILFFDPYFDFAGVKLLSLYASDEGHYVVFTSLPKKNVENERSKENINCKKNRIDNIKDACIRNHIFLKQKNIKIYGLKREYLHDRYIIIMEENGLPLVGYNLSNSLQTVAENYPLLITPIPADTLLEVENSLKNLVSKTIEQNNGYEQAIEEIFNSLEIKDANSQKIFQDPLEFLNKDYAGRALSIWTQESSLASLKGELLKKEINNLGLLKDGYLNITNHNGFSKWTQEEHSFEDFKNVWIIFGELLESTEYANIYRAHSTKIKNFCRNLNQFICESFMRKIETIDSNIISVIDPNELNMPLNKFIQNNSHTYGLQVFKEHHPLLTCAEYFAIELLWKYDPKSLITLIETKTSKLPINIKKNNILQLSILSEIVNRIKKSVGINITDAQLKELLKSNNSLVQWLGLFELMVRLQQTKDINSIKQKLGSFSNLQKNQFFGWLIYQISEKNANDTYYKDLILTVHSLLPQKLSDIDLRNLTDAMRGYMSEFSSLEPWLYSDILFPLIENKRVCYEYVSQIWIEEFISIINNQKTNQNICFNKSNYESMTKHCAILLANSCKDQRSLSINNLSSILKKQKRIFLQPLASSNNLIVWHNALIVLLWILAFAKWYQYYLQEIDHQIDSLIKKIEEIERLRNINEKDLCGTKELIFFIEQANKLNHNKKFFDL